MEGREKNIPVRRNIASTDFQGALPPLIRATQTYGPE